MQPMPSTDGFIVLSLVALAGILFYTSRMSLDWIKSDPQPTPNLQATQTVNTSPHIYGSRGAP